MLLIKALNPVLSRVLRSVRNRVQNITTTTTQKVVAAEDITPAQIKEALDSITVIRVCSIWTAGVVTGELVGQTTAMLLNRD